MDTRHQGNETKSHDVQWGGVLCGLHMGTVTGGLPRPCKDANSDRGFVASGTGVRFDAKNRLNIDWQDKKQGSTGLIHFRMSAIPVSRR